MHARTSVDASLRAAISCFSAAWRATAPRVAQEPLGVPWGRSFTQTNRYRFRLGTPELYTGPGLVCLSGEKNEQWARVNPAFYAGFLTAWTIVYAAAAAYCGWAARRPKPDAGVGVLALFFLTLAVAGLTTAASRLVGDAAALVLRRVAEATVLLSPVLLIHFVNAEERSAARDQLLKVGYAAGALLAAGALAGVYDQNGAASMSTTAGKLASIVFAAGVFGAAYFIGRARARSNQLGLGAFVGACALCVAAVYDAVTAVASALRPSLTLVGFTVFTLALFMDQIIQLARRREQLSSKTAELSKKAKSLSKSFRELRARQDELVRKEQLAAIGELSAVIAHEVRNPLAIMSNAVATLRRANIDDEARETLLVILSEEGARLNQLVGDLLHYAKPIALERQSVQLLELVKKTLAAANDKPNVVVQLSQGSDVPPVGGDPLLLRQVFDNLVNNALQAMSNGGTLTVELSKISHPDLGVGAELLIRDTGEGMDTVVRSRALDPFFTTRPSGTGLGLAIVARVIDAHGGRLTIRSELGVGTEVRAFVPAERDELGETAARRLRAPIIESFRSSRPSESAVEEPIEEPTDEREAS